MKKILISAIAAVVAFPASAITYEFGFTLGTFEPSGKYVGQNGNAPLLEGGIAVTGRVETDGSLGAIDESNIVSWNFLFTGELESLAFSSEGLLGDDNRESNSNVQGSFNATETVLTLTGPYQFSELGYVFLPDPSQTRGRITSEYYVGFLRGDGNGTVDGQHQIEKCILIDDACPIGPSAEREISRLLEYGSAVTDPLVGVAVPTVPLPASALFLFAGLGGLAVVRRL